MPQAGSGRRFRRPTSSTSTPPRRHPMRAGSRRSSPWAGLSFPGSRGAAARSRSSSAGPLAALLPTRRSRSASSPASGRKSRRPQAPAATPGTRARSGCAPTALPTPPRPPSTTTSGSPAIRCKPLALFAFSTLGAHDDALLDGLQPGGAVRDVAVEDEGRRRAADGIARRRLRDRIVRDDRVWRPAAGAKPRRRQKHRPSCHARHPQNPPDRKVPRALAGIKRRRAPSRIRPASVAFWARKREKPATPANAQSVGYVTGIPGPDPAGGDELGWGPAYRPETSFYQPGTLPTPGEIAARGYYERTGRPVYPPVGYHAPGAVAPGYGYGPPPRIVRRPAYHHRHVVKKQAHRRVVTVARLLSARRRRDFPRPSFLTGGRA